jgi:hypothetical protein
MTTERLTDEDLDNIERNARDHRAAWPADAIALVAEVRASRPALAEVLVYLEGQEWDAWRSSDGGREDFVGSDCCPDCEGMKGAGHTSACRIEPLLTRLRSLAPEARR